MKSNLGNKSNPYGDWLQNFEWTYWCTFTTRYTLSLPSARRLMWRMFDMRASASKSSPKIIQDMFWAAEPFDTREGQHTHALVKIVPHLPISTKMFCDIYQVAAGNVDIRKDQWHRVQVQKYNKRLGASHYCGKYITKTLSDYDFWGGNVSGLGKIC
jgi:hypothetical protein